MGMYTSVIVFECFMHVCQTNEQIIYQRMKTTSSKMLKKGQDRIIPFCPQSLGSNIKKQTHKLHILKGHIL